MREDPVEAHRRSLEAQNVPAPWHRRLDPEGMPRELFDALSPELKVRWGEVLDSRGPWPARSDCRSLRPVLVARVEVLSRPRLFPPR